MLLSFRVQICALEAGECLFFKLSGTAKHPLSRSWKVALIGVYTRELHASYYGGQREARKMEGGEGTGHVLAMLSVTRDSLLP